MNYSSEELKAMNEELYDNIRRYGKIISDNNINDEISSYYVRITKYDYQNSIYFVVMVNGQVVVISERIK